MRPVVINGILVTVANVMGDGLLGMNYLASANAWVGTKEGELLVHADGRLYGVMPPKDRRTSGQVAGETVKGNPNRPDVTGHGAL